MKNEEVVSVDHSTHAGTVAQFYGKEEIKGGLGIRNDKALPEGFNPTVGGSLYLESIIANYKEHNERLSLIKQLCLFCAGWVVGNVVLVGYILYQLATN